MNNGNLKPFKKGQSGNPGGRPKEIAEVKALARAHTITAINTLVPSPRARKRLTQLESQHAQLCSTEAGASPTRRITTMATCVSTSYLTDH